MTPKRTEGSEPDWADFLQSSAPLLREAGIPPSVYSSRDHWVDFVSHGFLDEHEDPDDFMVEDLDDDHYEMLKTLVAAYFRAGFEFFVPIALRPNDYTAMTRQFAGLRDRRED